MVLLVCSTTTNPSSAPAATRRHSRVPYWWKALRLGILGITCSLLSSTTRAALWDSSSSSSSWWKPFILPVSSFRIMTTMTLHPVRYNNYNIEIPPSHPIQAARNPLTGRWIQLTPFSNPKNKNSHRKNRHPSNHQCADRNTTTTTTVTSGRTSSTSTWQSTFLEQPGGWMVHRGNIVPLYRQEQQQQEENETQSLPSPASCPQSPIIQHPLKSDAMTIESLSAPPRWYLLEPTVAQVEHTIGNNAATTTAPSLPPELDASSLPRASDLLWLYKPDGLLTLPGKTEPDSLATQVNEYLIVHRRDPHEGQQHSLQPLQIQPLKDVAEQSHHTIKRTPKDLYKKRKSNSKRQMADQLQQAQAQWIPRPCHRLDRDTSGIIVMATTREAYTALSKQFEQRCVTKQYVAFVHGCLESDSGVIDGPIGEKMRKAAHCHHQEGEEASDESSYKVWTTAPDADKARTAETYYQVSRRYPTTIPASSYTRMILQPQTGRGHQLRLHMAEVLGHPILGDTLHGINRHEVPSHTCSDSDSADSHHSSSSSPRIEPPRLCLHAEYLQVWVLNDNNQVCQAKCWCLPPF